MTPQVKAILAHYESDNPGVKANLARILFDHPAFDVDMLQAKRDDRAVPRTG